MCVYIVVCEGLECATAYVWRSEDTLQESLSLLLPCGLWGRTSGHQAKQ